MEESRFGFRATGHLGVLQVGYQKAITFRDWDLTCSQDLLATVDCHLTGKIDTLDGFWSTQRPTEVRLQMQPGIWWAWNGEIGVAGTRERGGKIEVYFRGNFEIVKG